MTEHFGRRAFLKASVIGGAAMVFPGSSRETYHGLPGELQDLIRVPEPFVIDFQREDQGICEPYEVQVHPEGFYTSLRYIAFHEEQGEGAQKVHRFLGRNPINIAFTDSIRLGASTGIEGHYIPNFWPGGPLIEYTYGFLGKYLAVDQADKSGDRALIDGKTIGLTLFYVWQNIRNLGKDMLSTIVYDGPQYLGADWRTSYFLQNYPPVLDAEKKTEEILQDRLQDGSYYSADGHLGRFFSFTKIS